MRQLLPSRRGDKTERAWLLFSLLSGLLVWVAWGGRGPVNAQEPAKTDAAKDAPRQGGKGGSGTRGAGGRRQERGRAGGWQRSHPARPRKHAAVGDPRVRADWRVLARALDLLHGTRDPAVHGVPRQRGCSRRRWSISSRPRSETRNSRTRTTSAKTTTASWPGWCEPVSPTCPTVEPRPRRRWRPRPKKS